MKKVYAVIGSGRQGTAAAYDLARYGDPQKIFLADQSIETAQAAAERIRKLTGAESIRAVALDVSDRSAVLNFLEPVDVIISAVPYYFNLELAKSAITSRTSMCDLGGNTEIVFQELQLNSEAVVAGVTIVPDCGMVPGLGTSVCMYAMSLIDTPEEVYLWDGGLPVHPKEPWNYLLTFHFEGLVNEYFGTTESLRNGKLTTVSCFEEYELIQFPEPIGELEAFTTAGGTSSAPRTFLGKLRVYQNKTLRFKGHFGQWKAFRDAGLLEDKPEGIGDASIRPRDFLKKVLEPKIRATTGEADMCIIRALCKGFHKGAPAFSVVDLFDYFDETTGFTAMERTTGWHAAIVAEMIARDEIQHGAIPVELAASGKRIIEECKARGMTITEKVESGLFRSFHNVKQ